MVVLIMIALNGLFLFGNGLFMLVVPSVWYHFVPGVTHTGPFNQYFIRDIGLIQMFLGAALGIGMIRPASRLELWAAATSWLIAHAVLHLWEVAVGISTPSVIARDFPAVTLPALIGIALTARAWRSRPSKVRHAEQSARLCQNSSLKSLLCFHQPFACTGTWPSLLRETLPARPPCAPARLSQERPAAAASRQGSTPARGCTPGPSHCTPSAPSLPSHKE